MATDQEINLAIVVQYFLQRYTFLNRANNDYSIYTNDLEQIALNLEVG
ncbi:hypothetical protein [Williamsoniiplasma somnilux]|nr:hypothetical protein [Williamsoniiplasma somnilux]